MTLLLVIRFMIFKTPKNHHYFTIEKKKNYKIVSVKNNYRMIVENLQHSL